MHLAYTSKKGNADMVKSKYKAKKIEVDGVLFDSKKEAKRYIELTLLEQNGQITDLKTQVKYILIPAQYSTKEFTKSGKPKCIEREVSYIADFVYMDKDGNLHVEDVKGYRDSLAYSYYALKRKMLLYFYNIRIEEI